MQQNTAKHEENVRKMKENGFGKREEKGRKRGGEGVARRNARGRLKPYGLVRLIFPLGLNASHGLALKGLAEFNRSAHSAGPGSGQWAGSDGQRAIGSGH